MARPALAGLRAAQLTLKSLVETFHRQGLGAILWLPLIIYVLILVFAFLGSAPVLSPFIYPIF